MSFNTVAFGIYMGHNIQAEHFCKLIFSNIHIDGIKLENFKTDLDCYETKGTNFLFKIYDDIEYSDGVTEDNHETGKKIVSSTGEIGFTDRQGSIELENRLVSVKSDKEVSLKYMIERECFGKFTFAFYIEEIRYEIGKPHRCAFMVYSGFVSQWDSKTLVYYDHELIDFVNLKDKLIKQGRLNDDAAIGMIADCCI